MFRKIHQENNIHKPAGQIHQRKLYPTDRQWRNNKSQIFNWNAKSQTWKYEKSNQQEYNRRKRLESSFVPWKSQSLHDSNFCQSIDLQMRDTQRYLLWYEICRLVCYGGKIKFSLFQQIFKINNWLIKFLILQKSNSQDKELQKMDAFELVIHLLNIISRNKKINRCCEIMPY